MWQLGLPFMQACETAQPRGKVLIPLREMYPDASDEDIVIISGIACNNGICSSGDVVTFLYEGLQVGQLIVSVAVKTIGGWRSETVLARWKLAEDMRADAKWANCIVTGEDIVKILIQCIDTVLVWALAPNEASCSICMPPEIRPI